MSAGSVCREMSVWNVREEMSTEEVYECYGRKTIVGHNGSAFVKAAIVGGREITVPNVVGTSSHTFPQLTLTDSFYVGEVAASRPSLRMTYPIQRGVIVYMQELKMVWEHVFYKKLPIDPSNYSLIITEASIPNQKQSLDMFQEMFVNFGFKALLVVASLLTMYSNRYIDGIVVEIGDGLTQVALIHGGSVVAHGVMTSQVAGRDITDSLEELLGIQSQQFRSGRFRRIVNRLKENYGYVAANPLEENAVPMQYSHESLQTNLALESEKFQCVENLFNPQGLPITPYLESSGFIYHATSVIDEDLSNNIVLGGGSSSLRGLAERLKSELIGYFGDDMVINQSGRELSALRGGCNFARTNQFHVKYMTTGNRE